MRAKFHSEGYMLSYQNNQVIFLEKYFTLFQFLNVKYQFSSVVQLCLTLCDPVDCSTPGFNCVSEVIDISPGNRDSSLCFIRSGILHDVGMGEPGGLPSMGLHRVEHD